MAVAAPERTKDEPTTTEEQQTEVPPEQLVLPMIDKRKTDAIEITFGGTIKLDRSDPADCALVRKLILGKEVPLRVDGLVVERAGRTAHDRDGYFEGATLKTKIQVTTVSRPAGEQLDTDEFDTSED